MDRGQAITGAPYDPVVHRVSAANAVMAAIGSSFLTTVHYPSPASAPNLSKSENADPSSSPQPPTILKVKARTKHTSPPPAASSAPCLDQLRSPLTMDYHGIRNTRTPFSSVRARVQAALLYTLLSHNRKQTTAANTITISRTTPRKICFLLVHVSASRSRRKGASGRVSEWVWRAVRGF